MALVIEKVLEDRFEFVLDGGDVIATIYPRLLTDGAFCHFKTSTGANIIKKQDVPFFDITVIDTFGGSGTFTFNSVISMWAKLTELNFWGDSGTGGGSSTYVGLTDTLPFLGNDGQVPIVNEAANRLDYTTFHNISNFLELDDVAATSLIDGKIVGVTLVGGVPMLTMVDKPSDGTPTFSAVGGFDYSDLTTKTTPLSYVSGDLQLTNDILGAQTFLTQSPYGVTSVWDETINAFDFSQLNEGDEVFLRTEIVHTTISQNQETEMFLRFTDDVDGVFEIGINREIYNKSQGAHTLVESVNFYVKDSWKNNPVLIYYKSDDDASIIVNGWHPYIIRKSVNIVDIRLGKRITVQTTTFNYNLDHELYSDFKLTFVNTATLTDINMPSGLDTKEFTMKITGEEPILPSYWDVVGDSYDPNIWNFYAVQIHDGTPGRLEVTAFLSNLS